MSIDRSMTDDAGGGGHAAGGTKSTPTVATPTFMSTESLTFPGVSLISLGLVSIWQKAVGHDVSNLQIGMLAGILGLVLIIQGFVMTTNDGRRWPNWFGQLAIGIINTALLYGVMLGVATS
ncbi:MAG: hypothetical protein WA962_07225 [Ornithinimicrobium sp.]